MIRRLERFEPARYLWVGVTVAVANNVILIAGDWWGLGYAALMTVTWLAGGTLGYLLHSSYTFRRRRGFAAYARFMGGLALGVPLALALLAGLKSGLGLPMWIAAPTATAVMLMYNYLSARLAIVWRQWFSAT